MTRWSLRARIAVAVTITVLVAFLAGASLLVWLNSVDTQRSTSTALVRRLEQRGLVAEVERRQVPTGTLQALARRRLLLSALLAAAVAGPLGWVLVGKALDPLRRLREGAAAVAETSELSRRLPMGEGPEEVDSLARTLNSMLQRLQVADASLREALDSSRGFAAGAAHELRTPLTSLQADLDSLGSPALGDEERTQVLAEMQAEHERLVVLLDQLLALSRGDLGTDSQWEVVDVGDLVELAVGTAARRWPDTHLDVFVHGEQAVSGSPEGLRLLVDNLVANAAIHGGGAVAVSVSGYPGPPPTVVITVDDDGPGIPPEDRQRVLGRFERGRYTTTPGSGLGLALVDQQVRRHHGSLHLSDAPQGGLRVQAVLPAAVPAPWTPAGPPAGA